MAEQEEYIIKLNDQFGGPFKTIIDSLKPFKEKVLGANSNISALNDKLRALRESKDKSFSTKEITRLNREIQKTEKEVEKLNNLGLKTKESFSGVGGSIGKLTGALAPLLSGVAALGAIKSMVTLGMEAEQAETSFEVMLGSMDKAKKMVKDLKDMGAATPFEFTDLQDATKTLLSFGVESKAILPTLGALGDISGGNAEKLQSLSRAFGKVAAGGKLTGEVVNMMIDSSFNPLTNMAKQLASKEGITMEEAMAKMQKNVSLGKVTFMDLQDSIAQATAEGGQFYGMMDKQSQTTAGRLSTLQDQIASIGTSIGAALLPYVNEGMDKISYAFDWMTQNFDSLKEVFYPLYDAITPLVDTFKEILADMGLMSGEGNVLKNIFNGIGSVIKFLTPLMKVMYTITGFAIKGIYGLVKAIWAIIKPFAKLLGYKEQDFGFKDVEAGETKKGQSLMDYLEAGPDNTKGFMSNSGAGGKAAKDKKISDGISGVSGGRPTNITINIGALIKEYTNQITSMGGQVDLSNLKDMIKQVLMTAVNDSQIAIQ